MAESLEPFPEIMALGKDRLQAVCDEWCRGPQAGEFSVLEIVVPTDCRSFDFHLEISARHYKKGDIVHVPLDKVLRFIAEKSLDDQAKVSLKARLEAMRQRQGVTTYQRYTVSLQDYTMAVRCPHCSMGMKTQHRIFEGQQFELKNVEPVGCPGCHQEFTPSESDFFPVIDPDYSPEQ